MATQTIETYTPKTAAYIDAVFDADGRNRGGHHNHVIEQLMINAYKPVAQMSQSELNVFDENCLAHLKNLDTAK